MKLDVWLAASGILSEGKAEEDGVASELASRSSSCCSLCTRFMCGAAVAAVRSVDQATKAEEVNDFIALHDK